MNHIHPLRSPKAHLPPCKLLLTCIVLGIFLLAPCRTSAHDDGISHNHQGGLGETTLAAGDTLILSYGSTHCRIQYFGSTGFGHEITISHYATNQFDKVAESKSYLIQNGEIIRDNGLAWQVTINPNDSLALTQLQ